MADAQLRDEIARRMGEVQFSDLRAHLDRQAVFLVAPDLDLLDVAVAIAGDDAPAVQGWIGGGQLARPTVSQVDAWAQGGHRFFTAVVQPYVVLQVQAAGVA